MRMALLLAILQLPLCVSQGRDLPRPRMQLKSNSDWIMRERKEGLDWGFRFGYYYDGERLSGFAHGGSLA